jgi:HAD superfamily hydrolase (TIGR01490 family)
VDEQQTTSAGGVAEVVSLESGSGGVEPNSVWATAEVRRTRSSPRVRGPKPAVPNLVGLSSPLVKSSGAAFFDLDKTVIAKSSTLAFGRPFYRGGLVNRRAVLKSSFAQFVYLLQGADEDSMDKMRDYLAMLCAGWPVQQVQDIVAETLHELINPLVYGEAVQLFDEHRAAGRDVVLVSSSGEEVVEPIGAMLGVDRVVATRMVVEDGCYTGAIAFYAYGEGKAVAMRELAAGHGYDLAECYAYSDSFTDLPMLELVGHPTAVNPDKALRRTAIERDWPIREFRRPVRMRDRMPSIPAPPGPPAAYAGVAVAAGALGLTWWANRR